MDTSSYRVLVLTDHTEHTSNNSLYGLVKAMYRNPLCASLDIASRGVWANRRFFYHHMETKLDVVAVTPEFRYETDGSQFARKRRTADLTDYDLIFIRLPHPVQESFFDFLTFFFDEDRIINKPSGIIEAGSKAFLMEVARFCAPMMLCHSAKQVEDFSRRFPIVLKPLLSYGGKGLIKVDGSKRFSGDKEIHFTEYQNLLAEGFKNGGWLAMKYLKNVINGDKRIVVVNGKVIGASLRKPPQDSWLCNVGQGGVASPAAPTLAELEMISHLSPILLKKGVVMYGIDTLENDSGTRVLSEINALSVGGLTPMEKMYDKPILQITANELWKYIVSHIPTTRPLNH